jgi:hypothetical protein
MVRALGAPGTRWAPDGAGTARAGTGPRSGVDLGRRPRVGVGSGSGAERGGRHTVRRAVRDAGGDAAARLGGEGALHRRPCPIDRTGAGEVGRRPRRARRSSKRAPHPAASVQSSASPVAAHCAASTRARHAPPLVASPAPASAPSHATPSACRAARGRARRRRDQEEGARRRGVAARRRRRAHHARGQRRARDAKPVAQGTWRLARRSGPRAPGTQGWRGRGAIGLVGAGHMAAVSRVAACSGRARRSG